MILSPIPPDPEPTESELQAEMEHLSDVPEELQRAMASLVWRANRKRSDPDAFTVHFASDVPDYKSYLRSSKWRRIKLEVFKAADHRCAGCSEKANQVHHRDYRPRVLRGDDLSPLVALCKTCHDRVHHHDRVHYNDPKKKRTWGECEKFLADLVGREVVRSTSESS